MARQNRLLENVQVDLNISPELERLMAHNAEIAPKATKLGFRRVTREGSKQIKGAIRGSGHVQSGALAKSVRGSTTNRKSVIGTKLWYGHILEGGAKPHTISAKRGKFLRVPVGGRSVFTKSVHHPGTPAFEFFEKTFNQMQGSGKVQSLFAQGVQEAIEAVQNGQ